MDSLTELQMMMARLAHLPLRQIFAKKKINKYGREVIFAIPRTVD